MEGSAVTKLARAKEISLVGKEGSRVAPAVSVSANAFLRHSQTNLGLVLALNLALASAHLPLWDIPSAYFMCPSIHKSHSSLGPGGKCGLYGRCESLLSCLYSYMYLTYLETNTVIEYYNLADTFTYEKLSPRVDDRTGEQGTNSDGDGDGDGNSNGNK